MALQTKLRLVRRRETIMLVFLPSPRRILLFLFNTCACNLYSTIYPNERLTLFGCFNFLCRECSIYSVGVLYMKKCRLIFGVGREDNRLCPPLIKSSRYAGFTKLLSLILTYFFIVLDL